MIIDVTLSPPEIDLLPQADLAETTCVVFDVLRATSSMVTALAHGAGEIYPVRTIEEALEMKKQIPDAVLCGERFGDKIEGFDVGNSPGEYCALGGKRIITTTTNGTVALRACEKAERVLVGAFLNLESILGALRISPVERLLLVCAGTFRELALEDVMAAGAICARLRDAVLTDSARVALSVYGRYESDLLAGLKESRNGKALISAGRENDVDWSARSSVYDVVGEMQGGIIRNIGLQDR